MRPKEQKGKNIKTEVAGKTDFDKQQMLFKILTVLDELYPVVGTELDYQTPFELLVAAILSAQCTDKQVNRITERLFKKYNTPQDFAALTPEELAEDIKSCGLYRNKSKYIVEASRAILSRHNGIVPRVRSELEALPGIGRKTAGVVMGVAYGGEALPVDTHVFRVARRLGLSGAGEPDGVERDLTKHILPRHWMTVHHRLITHGRNICKARNPACDSCGVNQLCLYYQGATKKAD